MQTQKSFKDKWTNNKTSFFADIMDPDSEITKWILNRNGFSTIQDFKTFLNTKKRILDGGCGNGRITYWMANLCSSAITGIDYSSHLVAKENLAEFKHVTIQEGNLLSDLHHLGKFDYIYCQEVLHHTGNPANGFSNLAEILEPGGELAIYVYKKKAPIREFVDDYIRDQIKHFDYDQAMALSEKITQVGKSLADLKTNIKVPDIQELGIKGGEYDVQRFFYHFFMKCFWNEKLSMNENVVVNYDWYHPEECTRHTLEEVRGWFISKNLKVIHECEDEYGITMRGISAR